MGLSSILILAKRAATHRRSDVPVACTPASGRDKGQVENQVGVVRRWFFVPRPRFKSYAELNAWLEDRCVAWAKSHPHPEMSDRTTREVFEE